MSFDLMYDDGDVIRPFDNVTAQSITQTAHILVRVTDARIEALKTGDEKLRIFSSLWHRVYSNAMIMMRIVPAVMPRISVEELLDGKMPLMNWQGMWFSCALWSPGHGISDHYLVRRYTEPTSDHVPDILWSISFTDKRMNAECGDLDRLMKDFIILKLFETEDR